jgi:hypothetical protein
MPIEKPKRVEVVKEYCDNYERKKVFGKVQLEWDGVADHPDQIVFEAHRVRKEHFHNNLLAWGISTEIWEDLRKIGVDKIRIVSRPLRESEHENEIFEVTMREAMKCGSVYQFADYDPQYFVPESCMYDPREVYF